MTRFANSLVIGAGGGIGRAIADRLEAGGGKVARLSRSSDPAIDYLRPDSINAAATAFAGSAPFDLIFIATGTLHGEDFGPEKSLKMLEADQLDHYFRINATGPALVARHFLPLLAKDGTFAALSARVGSIGDNRLGGWYGYRASKAALNQLIRTLAIEVARKHKAQRIVALHPGTVDTDLSAPFQGNVPEGKLFTPDHSAQRLLTVLETLTPEQSGRHFDWAGEEVIP
ncbi:SDR family NAD(P)-dependent oxidoreductase [Sphingomicrobium flavum]|uniref:SDR family NAD(P)-dependent oxidoreductase n=1 Tax=Sphingomicrobium flavum TaxID=1229164 RepID=UPI0021ADAC65|nr:SDR family NAD(P)-dependent oxidoreductase [Sphingomicrobium flavum]